ncbi:hypothetical protein LDENG_00291040 [Lucifuga dentata]|nr:hypothetical protein LDENG_00291040 [Lucifuga dentata]
METMQELIPFAREMLSQKPNRGLVKVYLVGSVFAVLGTLIGLVETVCHPFSSGETTDTETLFMFPQDQRTVEAKRQSRAEDQEEREEDVDLIMDGVMTQGSDLSKTSELNQRSMANRLHAS